MNISMLVESVHGGRRPAGTFVRKPLPVVHFDAWHRQCWITQDRTIPESMEPGTAVRR